MSWALPIIALAVLIAVPVSVRYFVRKDRKNLSEESG
jgi:hypothetical protein